MNEAEIVKKAKSGDKQAFCELYMKYNDRLYRYAYLRLGNEADARDAVSDCIVEAYENIGGLKNEKAFCAWIFKIMYRSCCSLQKRQINQKNQTSIDDLNEADTAYCENPEYIEVRRALDVLNSEDRELVLLSVVAGYTSKEIASLTGMNSATVRTRLSRSLAKMRNYLE